VRENEIKAVLQRDLKKLLKSLGVYESVRNNTQCCFFCHKTVSIDTISAVFPYQNTVCFCCENPACCNALIDLEQEEEELESLIDPVGKDGQTCG
jgi:hypothetical protein